LRSFWFFSGNFPVVGEWFGAAWVAVFLVENPGGVMRRTDVGAKRKNAPVQHISRKKLIIFAI
jgi:hypothetical protein